MARQSATEPATKPLRWNTFRNVLQKLHLWVGLALAIPFILIGVTGSIIIALTYQPALSEPAATAQGEIAPIARILAAAQASVPEGYEATTVVLPPSEGRPAAVQVGLPSGQRPADRNLQGLIVYVDPVSAEVLGTTERRRAGPFKRTVTAMHIALMAPGHYGLQTVGFMGVFMTLFGITGLILWWPKRGQWRQGFVVKRGATGWRLNRDLHSVFGIWTLLVFLMLSISGVYLAFPVTFQSVLETVLPMENTLTPVTVPEATLATISNPNAVTPDEAIILALAAVPRSRALSVQVPPIPDGIHMVTLAPEPFADDAPQISVFVGPGTDISDVVDPRGYALGKRILSWMRVMHYGQGFGFVWSMFILLCGFLPVLFVITGVRMWWLKRAQRRVLPVGAVAPAE